MPLIDILGNIFGTSGSDAAKWWPTSLFGGRKTTSGTQVSPSTALGLPAYFACIRVLGEDVAKLPLKLHRTNPDNSNSPEFNHPAARLLAESPNGDMSAFTFRETLTAWAAGWGNGYAEIAFDGAGKVAQLYPIHPSRVTLKRIDGELVYIVRSEVPGAQTVGLRPEEVFHLKGLGDGLLGYSVAQIGCESIGQAMAGDKFASAYYGNNTTVGGVLEHPGKLSEEARKHLRESWEQMHAGPENAHRAAILEEGLKFHATSVNPRDSQMIESRQFDIETVCRWFRIPPHKIQHLLRATFTNIEQQSIEYVVDTLLPWLVRWESEIKRKLLRGDLPLYAKHSVNGLLRGDAAARGAFYSQLFQIGVLSANDIRRLEDMEPAKNPASDKYFVQGALVPIEDAGKNVAKPAPAPEPKRIETGKPAQATEQPRRSYKLERGPDNRITALVSEDEPKRRTYTVVRAENNLITNIFTEENKS